MASLSSLITTTASASALSPGNSIHLSKNYDYSYYNFIILGDENVGKTAIFDRFCNEKSQLSNEEEGTGQPLEEKKKQKALDIFQKVLYKDDKQYRLKLWDTYFDQSYVKLNKPIYERADCIIIVFAVNDRASFDNIVKWIQFLEDNIDISMKHMALFCNKIDLTEERKVTIEEIKEKAKDLDMDYYEMSASNGIGINEAFNAIVDNIMFNKTKESSGGIKIDEYNNSSGKGCAK